MNARTVGLSAALILIVVAASACATDPGFVPREDPPPTGIGIAEDLGDQPGTETTEPSTDAVPVAAAFADAWGRPDLSDDAWAQAIYPLCTPRYGTLLLGYPRPAASRAVPTTDPVEISRKPGQRVYDVGTDAGTLTITVVAMDASWKVDRASVAADGGEMDAAQPKPDIS